MSEVTLGLWSLGESAGFHEKTDPRTAKNRIKDAWRDGITSFDTAFSYGTDTLLYSALKEIGVRTDDAKITEKVMPVPTFRKKTEACLRALRTERVTNLLIHWPADMKMLFPALREAEKMLDEGKALHIGASNFPTSLLREVSRDFPLSIHERAYSPVWIRDEQDEPLPLMLYGIFGFGTLFHEEPPEDERGKLYMYGNATEFRALCDEIGRMEEKHGVSRAEVLFSFAQRRSDAIIIGSGGREYLKSGFTLSEEEHSDIYMKALDLDRKAGSDNIFGHRWSQT